MNFEYPLASSSWGNEEIDAINKVIKSNKYTMGKYVEEFEREFSNFFGSKYCVMANSGSSANLLMIASLFYTKNKKYKLKKGDEIIVPAVSWSTSYFPLYQYGLKIKFVDIDLQTLNYDINKLKQAVTDKTRSIMIINLLGNPNEFNEIEKIAKSKNIFFFEDNCESMGAIYRKKFTGTFGIMGSFSTFFSHHMSTMEGGLVLTDDEELHQIMLCLRAHGWTRNLPKNNLIGRTKSDNYFDESFRFILPGFNLRPLEMSGAIGLEQLKKLPKFIEERRKNALIFKEIMFDKKQFIIQQEIGSSSWFGFSLIIKEDSGQKRESVLEKLNKLGIETRPIVSGDFTKNEVIKYFDYEISDELKNADYLDKNGFFIGNHHYPIEDQLQLIKNI